VLKHANPARIAKKEFKMESTKKKPFNRRAFTSVAMFLSGILLPVSGIMNHKLAFSGFTPQYHFWMSVHNMSALIFCICALTHASYNWRALLGYINKVKSQRISKEALYAVILVLGVVGLFSSHALHVR
jgi:hypothetical protein